MTPARAIAHHCVDLIDAYAARADARAYLWSLGELGLAEAVDQLQRDAERDELIDRIGQDNFQALLVEAFQPYREAADV
jgi:hypothetical protein